MVWAILAEMSDVNQQGKKWNIYGLSQELKQNYLKLEKKGKIAWEWIFTPLMF